VENRKFLVEIERVTTVRRLVTASSPEEAFEFALKEERTPNPRFVKISTFDSLLKREFWSLWGRYDVGRFPVYFDQPDSNRRKVNSIPRRYKFESVSKGIDHA
jgi:hypothetical protein